jgi:hypothetical protein
VSRASSATGNSRLTALGLGASAGSQTVTWARERSRDEAGSRRSLSHSSVRIRFLSV